MHHLPSVVFRQSRFLWLGRLPPVMGTFPQQLRCRTIISLNLSDCNLFSQKSPKKASGRVADFKVSIEFICFSKKSCLLIYFQPNGIIPSASSPINQTVSPGGARELFSWIRTLVVGSFFTFPINKRLLTAAMMSMEPSPR